MLCTNTVSLSRANDIMASSCGRWVSFPDALSMTCLSTWMFELAFLILGETADPDIADALTMQDIPPLGLVSWGCFSPPKLRNFLKKQGGNSINNLTYQS
jgi:hypothetical protein